MVINSAIHHLQALLGVDATDDNTWRDLQCFEQAAAPAILSIWQFDQILAPYPWHLLHPSNNAELILMNTRRDQAVIAVQQALGQDSSRCAAAFFLHPQLWTAASTVRQEHWQPATRRVYITLLQQVAEAVLRQQPPAGWTNRICRRMNTLCLASAAHGEPAFEHCVRLLLDSEDALVTPLLDALSSGAWPEAACALAKAADTTPDERLSNALQQAWPACHIHTERLLRRLAQQGHLNTRAFRRLIEILPHGLQSLNMYLANQSTVATPDPQEHAWHIQLRDLLDIALWELISDIRPESWPTLSQIQILSGGRYLLRIAEQIDRQSLTTLPKHANYNYLAGLFTQILHHLQRREDDDSAALTALLASIHPTALLAILPHTAAYDPEICGALGWPGASTLMALLRRIEALQPSQSADPRAGVLDRNEVLQVTASMDEAHIRSLLEACATHLPDAVLLVRAVLGWNTKEVRRLFGRRNRMAVRALALLPITKPDEVLQRYVLLARYQREAKSSSAGRKAYERAAAAAGLANLAATAGYVDATRLEWAMQAQLGAERTAIGRSWEIEGYTITLTLADRGPTLSIRNPKRVLKRFPALVTRDYAYREVRATLEQAQDQDRRIRQAFLDAMCSANPLTADELALLRANPIAAQQLARLILIDEAGACGLFCPDDGALEGTYGERVRISGAVTIAHTAQLAQQGLLSDWQTQIVRRQIVQPFKQAFRELYLITPAELAVGTSSARLAGRRIRGRQALAVLANMGWLFEGYVVRKPFYALGFAAQFETGVYDYNDEDGARTGSLTFWPLEHRHQHDQRIPLTDVPPLIFSEVVRDLDLVSSIAYQSEDGYTSREVLQRRADLVQATACALGLRQVQVDGSIVSITGQRSSYRINLATAGIYLASGQYLCIVPKPATQEAIYLPFTEGGDPITTEVISKVLLLANDQMIRDQTILAQIVPQRLAA